jgi:uncharacterized protein
MDFQGYLSSLHSNISFKSALAVLELSADGGTVPFIARYRKEKTGNLDEVEIRAVLDAKETFEEVTKRKAFILKEIEGQGNLTDELKKRIETSMDLGDLEEIYRPFKKKKKTKATIARESGLEPLADWIWQLGHGELEDEMTIEVKAKNYLNAAAGFVTYELALKGAQDIIVDRIFNNPELREIVREEFMKNGKVISKKTKEFKAHSKYEMYADFSEAVKTLQEAKASHRYLAMRRGWTEGELTVVIEGDQDMLFKKFENFACSKPTSQAAEFLKNCAKLALTVHVHPSISNEVHRILKDSADKDAISVFAENVRRVLLGSPFGPRCVLGVDPGLRTGCKIALIDRQGNFISNTVLQMNGNEAEAKAKTLFAEVMKQITIDAVAVGNGTGGREAEAFLRKVLKDLGASTPVILISESGASVYSASDVAREEFPDLDLTVRGAISIARRLQDPLAELVKVDPKSIGVGQYQHDVSQPQLKKSLEAVVESCVNSVGVDLNTASDSLLSYVSGIGPGLAKNILEFRKTNGLFEERSQLMKIPRFSSKVFEQSAGFLRIHNGKIPLDNTGIHPERYAAVKDMAAELAVTPSQLMGEGAKKLAELRPKWAALVGEYTFDDIVRELEKPGRDPRDPFKVFSFRDDIFEVKDLKEGMICPGIVTNVTNFGAFVDIGVHQDGLVHISELSHKFVDDPRKVVNPGDQVTIRVLKVDTDKNQISLSMLLENVPRAERVARDEQAEPAPRAPRAAKAARAPRAEQRGASAAAGTKSAEGGSRPQIGGGAKSAGPRPASSGPRPSAPGAAAGRAPAADSARSSGPRAGGGSNYGTSRPPQQRAPATPFNNPFAALMGQATEPAKGQQKNDRK